MLPWYRARRMQTSMFVGFFAGLLFLGCSHNSEVASRDVAALDAASPDVVSADATSCTPDTQLCGVTCTATATDPNNCGQCGTVCNKGQSCSGGQCGSVCNGTTINCGGLCVDVQDDAANCGRCGHACSSGQVCSAGKCGASCTGGTSNCGGTCVDESSDPTNCGGCGVICPVDQVCAPGGCTSTCPTNTQACFQSCVDTTTDPTNCGECGVHCTAAQVCTGGSCLASNIQHVVLIVEENHTFDSYFGRYCTAPAGSNPACTSGPTCCEAAPATEPHGASPTVLDDASNSNSDRNHAQACELYQMDNGAMDRYVNGSFSVGICDPTCSTAANWALAAESTMSTYWGYAGSGALADRYFQPIAGSSSSNDVYFAIARFQFKDDALFPSSIGSGCVAAPGFCGQTPKMSWSGRTTIADLLKANGVSFGFYADGYADAVAAAPNCPNPPSDCPLVLTAAACKYDPSDIPFNYYTQLADDPQHMKDFGQLSTDLAGTNLPSLVYVKARTYQNEHPNYSTIARGVTFVSSVVQMVEASTYGDSTLILLTWDEGGGFFDHIAPPPAVDAAYDQDDSGKPVPYGTRVPLIAIGKFARAGTVSHVQMEHSSIVRFLEYNFLGPFWQGALGNRDAIVNNIGSLLDPSSTGIAIP
jgi:phospholipase C